jgi:adenylate kinase family enzyme
MSQRILIMGLPGSGKTTLAGALKKYLELHGSISYSRALMEPMNKIEQEVFDESIHSISATKIRKELGLK